MPLQFQDPEDLSAPFLLEAILKASIGATSGGALFAFATQTGVRLLMQDKTFTSFSKKNAFNVVVGVDSVTDEKALQALVDVMASYPKVRAKVFLHNRSIWFHPKTLWFRTKKGGTLITGSGNLTVGGLRANWEAFTVTNLTAKQAQEIQDRWDGLVKLHTAKLFDPKSAEARTRASQNSIRDLRPRSGKNKEREADTKTQPAQVLDIDQAELITSTSPVLIAEIPKAANRWNQGNFSLETYTKFFGANVTKQTRVLLQHVKTNGDLEELESRPTVVVKSRNFRFELGAAKGKGYPSNGRPIAVFLRQSTGIFLYRLIFPSDTNDYSAVTTLLSTKWSGPKSRIRRVITSTAELKTGWPRSPLWNVGTAPE
jgi:HKD family nuclease